MKLFTIGTLWNIYELDTAQYPMENMVRGAHFKILRALSSSLSPYMGGLLYQKVSIAVSTKKVLRIAKKQIGNIIGNKIP